MNERINKIIEETERLYTEWRLSPGMERKIPSLIEEKQFMYETFAELIVRECAHLVGGYVKENEFGPATDVKEAYEEITKHFGVEE